MSGYFSLWIIYLWASTSGGCFFTLLEVLSGTAFCVSGGIHVHVRMCIPTFRHGFKTFHCRGVYFVSNNNL